MLIYIVCRLMDFKVLVLYLDIRWDQAVADMMRFRMVATSTTMGILNKELQDLRRSTLEMAMVVLSDMHHSSQVCITVYSLTMQADGETGENKRRGRDRAVADETMTTTDSEIGCLQIGTEGEADLLTEVLDKIDQEAAIVIGGRSHQVETRQRRDSWIVMQICLDLEICALRSN